MLNVVLGKGNVGTTDGFHE